MPSTHRVFSVRDVPLGVADHDLGGHCDDDDRADGVCRVCQGIPPSSRMNEPLVNVSEAQHNAAPTISDGSPTRFSAALSARSSPHCVALVRCVGVVGPADVV